MTCGSCNAAQADKFCICTEKLPVLCAACRPKHESKAVAFHYPVSTAFYHYVQTNYQWCKHWLLQLSEQQEKLRTGLGKFDACRQEIEAAFDSISGELRQLKTEYLANLDNLQESLTPQVESAIQETTDWPFQSPSGSLAILLYNGCCNFESMEVFSYQVAVTAEGLKDCVQVMLKSPVPELTSLNRDLTGHWQKEIAEGKRREADLRARFQQLTEQYEALQVELNSLKTGYSQPTATGYPSQYSPMTPSEPAYRPAPISRMSYQPGCLPLNPGAPLYSPSGSQPPVPACPGLYASSSLPDMPKPALHGPSLHSAQPMQPYPQPHASTPLLQSGLARAPPFAQQGQALSTAPGPALYKPGTGTPQAPAAPVTGGLRHSITESAMKNKRLPGK